MRLRNALRANAAFSGVSGVALVAAARPVAALIGLHATWVLVVIGVGLAGYAVQLLVTARRDPIDEREVKVAIGADLAWVAGSAILLAWGPLTRAGNALVALVAGIVLVFALAQASGLRRARETADASCGGRGR